MIKHANIGVRYAARIGRRAAHEVIKSRVTYMRARAVCTFIYILYYTSKQASSAGVINLSCYAAR
jgi:hypothetical protein